MSEWLFCETPEWLICDGVDHWHGRSPAHDVGLLNMARTTDMTNEPRPLPPVFEKVDKTQTFAKYPGFTFHRFVERYTYAKSGHVQDHGRGHAQYGWFVTRTDETRILTLQTKLSTVKEILDMMIEDGEV